MHFAVLDRARSQLQPSLSAIFLATASDHAHKNQRWMMVKSLIWIGWIPGVAASAQKVYGFAWKMNIFYWSYDRYVRKSVFWTLYFTVSNTNNAIFFLCKSEFVHTFQELYRWRWLRTINIAWNVTMVYSVTLCKFLWKFLWFVVQFQPTPLMKHCKEFVIITINYVPHNHQPK